MRPNHQEIMYETASQSLMERFPELANDYAKELEWWGDETPGSHVVFGDVLCPFIDRVLTSGTQATRGRVFDFLEELAGASDTRVRDLFTVTVYPYLQDDEMRLQLARRYFGRATRKLAQSISQ